MNSNETETSTFFKTYEEQDLFAEAVFSGKYKFLMLAGDIRSGKTIVCLIILVILCKVFVGSRWCVVRKDRPTLQRNTIATFFKYCCPKNFSKKDGYNRSDLTVEFTNGSQIMFMSAQLREDPDMNRFKGLEVNGFLFDQAEELIQDLFFIAVQRAGQWVIDPMPPQLILLNCNPANNWVKYDWYDRFVAGALPRLYYFMEASMDKNPYITADYKETLKATLPPAIYERFCKRRWESIDEIMQLNSWDDIYGCKPLITVKDKTLYMGVDVGHSGSDPSVWTVIDDNVREITAIPKTTVPEVTAKTKELSVRWGISADHVCVDTVGIGAGVGDELEAEGWPIIRHSGGTACGEYLLSNTNFKFMNYRSWSHWVAADSLKHRRIGGFSNPKLVSEAGAIKYGIKTDKQIFILPKEQLRIKLKRSTDYWDSYTYAWWAKVYSTLMPQPGIVSIDFTKEETEFF